METELAKVAVIKVLVERDRNELLSDGGRQGGISRKCFGTEYVGILHTLAIGDGIGATTAGTVHEKRTSFGARGADKDGVTVVQQDCGALGNDLADQDCRSDG